MNYVQVEYFLKVAECGNITAAANELFITQPAVSRQILQLEKEIGVTLFFRNTQGVILTPEGEQLYLFFVEQKDNFAQLINRLRRSSAICDAAIWMQDGLEYSIVDQLVDALHIGKAGNQDVTVGVVSFDELNQKLRKIDQIALIAEDMVEDKSDLMILPVANIQQALVYSSRLFSDGKQPTSPAEFKDKSLLIYGNGVATRNYRQRIMDICKGCALKVELKEIENRERLTREILVGNGFTVGSVISCEVESGDIFHTLPLDTSSVFCIAYRKDSTKFVTELAKELQSFLSEMVKSNSADKD